MTSWPGIAQTSSEYTFLRDLRKVYPQILSGKGNYLTTKDGREVFDACSGAAVSCLGVANQRVIEAIHKQLKSGTPYLASSFWANDVVEDLSKELIQGTNNQMGRVYLTGSGSEAMEAAIKLSRQYFYEQDPKTPRVNFIARKNSYHGNTLGACCRERVVHV
ncbi:aminotransferase (mitochondrion) [Apiospora phragmitis]|uniref:Aminotransferase n=1 Tax=Apiospora phragmitis TaxID=2905665 RepID=A0ABR1SS87_9PEZI